MSQPMSRSMMQGLFSQKKEEAHVGKIKNIVEEIYREAVEVAGTTTEIYYIHEIPSTQMTMQPPSYRRACMKQYASTLGRVGSRINLPYYQGAPDPFYIKNMPDILAGLQKLFPDCSVSHTLLCQGKDGKMYDVAKLDDSILPFVDRALDQSYIVINWA
jgi:hypothetical protein